MSSAAAPVYPIAYGKFAERLESLPAKLLAHLYRTRDVGLELAQRHHLDAPRAELGILAHDVARTLKKREMLRQADGFALPALEMERRAPVLLHGPVGAELLRQEDGLDDAEVLDAVRWHSTGHPNLTPLGLVVFLADKLDPNKLKSYPYQPQLRAIANESLPQAALEFLTREAALRLQRRRPVHPSSIAAINALLLAGG